MQFFRNYLENLKKHRDNNFVTIERRRIVKKFRVLFLA